MSQFSILCVGTLKFQHYCQFLYFWSHNTPVYNVNNSIILVVCRWWLRKNEKSLVFQDFSCEVDGDFCSPACSRFDHSLTFSPLLSAAGGKPHCHPEREPHTLTTPPSLSQSWPFFSFPHRRLFTCALSCIHLFRLLWAVSGLPSGGDWQPSSSCFVPFPLCPPSIPPSVAGIYAALLQSLRRTSWLLPGEANWLLSHTRARSCTAALGAHMRSGERAHTGMVWGYCMQMAFACWQPCHWATVCFSAWFLCVCVLGPQLLFPGVTCHIFH